VVGGLTIAHLKDRHMSGDSDAGLEIRTKAGLVDIRIVDADMNELARDDKATGEVVARAPWLTQGYFLNPEASEQLWTGGYLHTNDTANIGPDGYVQIADRIKDVIKTGGEWVSSAPENKRWQDRQGGPASKVRRRGLSRPRWRRSAAWSKRSST
jgi:fatty-acyl-CoA synthase